MANLNKLVNEQSPYLLQHANNPVYWYPWCEEAFEKAKSEDKPIFLSIGYSTCHWCHVMEKESFEDEQVAKLMNEFFISIKVDREERPDIDGIYMTVCQMLTGSGGWPMTIVMTPDKKPFFAGTYFPKHGRYGRIGMLELIPKLKEVWRNKRNDVLHSADEITRSLMSISRFSGDEILDEEILHEAFKDLSRKYDSRKGGFSKAPKFPTPHNIMFLLRYWKRTGNKDAIDMVEKTLIEMRLGGIYDHVGFGFHRYSTDENWLVPHFEKMLYDQALLALAYIEAYQATKNILFKETAREILEYVKRDMTSDEGGFFSAEDADSEGEEGKFYLWTFEELKNILKEDAEFILDYYNAEREGNWIDSVHGGKNGTNILHSQNYVDDFAAKHGFDPIAVEMKIVDAKKILFAEREKRTHPHKDDKILTDWNSLMISAFAKAAQVFDEPSYIVTAERTVNFLLNKLKLPNGRLLHRYRNGHVDIQANLDDYAFFINALLNLYETTFSVECLTNSIELQSVMYKLFWDDKDGGFFFTPFDSEKLLVRRKEIYDGAVPSGNSYALINLIRLYRITGNLEYEEKAVQLVKTFSNSIKLAPSAFTYFLCGLDFSLGPSKEIIIVGNDIEKAKNYLKIIHSIFLPNKVILYMNDTNRNTLAQAAEFTNAYSKIGDNTVIYICEDFKCELPLTSVEDLSRLLQNKNSKSG